MVDGKVHHQLFRRDHKKTLDLTAEGSWSIFRALLLPSRELGGFTFNTNPWKMSKAKNYR